MNKNNIKIATDTLQFLKKKSWNELNLDEILKKSKNKSKTIKTKNDLLKNINKYVDYLLKKEISTIEKSTPRDMLFEVIMARFDVLQKYRSSFLILFKSFKSNPQKFLILMPTFLESMILMASLADIKIKGINGSLKIKGIFIVYIATFFEWVKDNSKSLDRTMNSLDKYINQSSKILNFIKI